MTNARKGTSLKEGDVLAGRYRIERVIAMGGMGVVVAARHAQLGQRVAIKVLHENTASPQTTARFLTEAKASAQLRSEHVVKVSDVGLLDSGEPFMVMELLEGQNLAEALEAEGPMPVTRAVEYVLAACEGIAEAHAARIIHRDLKPENLFRAVRSNGTTIIKVLDFGVSKALSEDIRAEGTVTTTDAVFGSPFYMSPEQMLSATRADERSDIWSLGVVLYELVTGKTPFEADNMAGIAVAIATQPPRPLRAHAPGAPIELEAVIEKCLQKDPALRYPNVGELAADLEPFAPNARHHVETIQRLVSGDVLPPRSIPSAPASQRNVAFGAETLGPLDAALSGAFELPPKRRPWLPAALGAGAFLVVAIGGLVIVRTVGGSPTASSGAATASAPLATTATATASETAPLATSVPPPTATATATEPPVAIATTRTALPRPILVPSVSGPTVKPAVSAAPTATAVAPVAPSASAMTGISHDRK